MKLNVFVFVLLLSSIIAPVVHAQHLETPDPTPVTSPRATLSGKVTDAVTGQPLAGASIFLHDLRIGVMTNQQGQYIIRQIPPGRYLVEVSYTGYAPMVESVQLSEAGQKDFALVHSFIENDAVTVTGVSAATSLKRTPVPVSILKKEELFRSAGTNLIDVLSKTPGVAQVSTGPAISKPFIRGLGYNRVVVVNDGIRQEGQQWGDEHGVEIDEYNVSRVEILKGPASLMYGSDALAGVVNIISIVPAPQNTIKGNVFGTYQTNNRQRGFHADLGGNHQGLIWGAYGSYKAAADYQNKYDGYVFNSKFNEQAMGGYLGLNRQWGFSHLYASYYKQHVGLVEGDRDESTGQFLKLINDNGEEGEAIADKHDFTATDPYLPRQQIRHFKLGLDNSFRIGDDRLTFLLGYQRNQREEFGNVLDPAEKELYFDLHTLNYNLQYHFAEKNQWKTSIGINGMQQTNQNKGEEALIPEYSLFDIGGFLYTQKRINRLTLSGGLRFDNRSINAKELAADDEIKFAHFTKQFSNVSGSAGLSYEASKAVTLKFNIARGFRAPSIPELASNGAHEGTNRYEYGSLDLKSETSLQLDAGLEIATQHVSMAASVFYNAVQNYIYYRKLSAVGGGDSILVDGSDAFFAFQYDQHNARLYGAELNLDIHPHPLDWLHIENSFSYVRGTLSQEQDGSKNLPFIPAARLVNEVKVELLPKGKTIRGLFLRAELDNTFAQNDPFTGYNTETRTAGYSLLNAGIGGDVMGRGKVLFSLFFAASNIGDVAWQNHLSRLKYTAVNNLTGRQGVYNMGRNFSIKLNVPLSFTVGH
ncbi:MAG: TonB-dependent receptor [Candidatus Pseudobacter hemicellulosilyticus]|uniref:TonB-dependent receptor n=1 Tax=Candidatus Pseudobacter hemicellulosilyticus TaxID=3121375 RepID=A0AAJ5WUV1_9BACT|nr:MAG: TonB-dependent receptor [Pseudobacter sp.]